MKQKKLQPRHLIGFACIGLFILMATACQKGDPQPDPKPDYTSDMQVAADQAHVDNIFDDIQKMADQGAFSGELITYKREETIAGGCSTIMHDTSANPNELIIDFGTANCLCKDGRNRRGKIISSYTGRYRDSGTVITHTFDDYHVNDFQVLGLKTVTNKGRNSAGNKHFEIVIDGKVLTPNKQDTVYSTSNRIREWVAGENTWNWLDDAYLISGTGNISSNKGYSADYATPTPLRIELNCKYIVSGIFQMTPAGKIARSIDYGNGTCDDQATFSVGNYSTVFTLR